MRYTIHVNEVKEKEGGLRGFATVVFDESFKITNIAIFENGQTGKLFVSMPRFKAAEQTEDGKTIYKDICNPVTKEFREELYDNILGTYEKVTKQEPGVLVVDETEQGLPFSLSVSLFEREGSNVCALARIYLADCFVINNVSVFQGKEDVFVTMPSYKTNQKDENGKAVYQNVVFPVTKEFREKLFSEVINSYKNEKSKAEEQKYLQTGVEKAVAEKAVAEKETPFR